MTTNESTLDRALRVAIGMLLVGLTWTGMLGAWGYIGVILIVTGVVGLCPIYSLLGITTDKDAKA